MISVKNIGHKIDRQKWLEIVLEKIGKALFTTDRHGNITYLNEAAGALTGKPESEVLGTPISEALPIFYTVDNSEVKYPLAEALKHNRMFTASQGMYFHHPAGKKQVVTYTVSPLSGHDFEIEGLVIVICNYDFNLASKTSTESLVTLDTEGGATTQPSFYTKREGQFVRVLINDILWIEAMENYAQLVTKDDRFIVHSTMKGLAARMQDYGFVRVHRSYIAPIDRVDAIEENRLYIGEKEIPIGKSFRAKLMKALNFI